MDEFLDTEYYEKEGVFLDVEITAYVEGFEDDIFWRDIFAKYAPSLKINFYPHSRENELKSGVQEVLKEKNKTGKNLILCIDSDFRYLLQDNSISENPYIFQTYTYSIENHKCAPRNLNRIVKTATLVDGNFDFITFLKQYSQTVYPLFLYLIYFEKKKSEKIQNEEWITGEECVITEKKLKEIIGIPSHEVTVDNHAQTTIEALEKRVTAFINEIKVKHDTIDLTEIENDLRNHFEIESSDVFWYINGHLIYDNVVLLMLNKLILSYKKQQKQKYDSMPTTKMVQTKYREYQNYLKNIKWETLLMTNHLQCLAFENNCPLMEKIKADVITFCQDRKLK